MRLHSIVLGLLFLFVVQTNISQAQQTWPKSINGFDGSVLKLYEWQPESFSNNELKVRAAISVLENGKTDPVFGVAWLQARTRTNGDQVEVESVHVNSIKLPGDIDDDKLENFRTLIEKSADNWNISIPLANLQSSVDLEKQQTALSNQISSTPPKVVYSASPSILVLIDGAPKVQYNNEWESDAVVNTPFTIIKNEDNRFYLYGGKHWYTAPAATGPYVLTTSVSQKLQKIEQKVNDAEKKDNVQTESDENTIYKIIVSTEPAELLQTKGEASFSAVEGSGLLYVSNSENDIFMDVNSQEYYVLLSGRWYRSKTLSGNWQYISADNLPGDFARIPEGSPKDNVLASIAGTEAAKNALEEAEVPQTARVNRHSAQAEVIYDGQPEFEVIDGTDLAYATNTSASVIRWRGRYYSVDNGIWFESGAAMGPWAVSVSRPYVVALIPPRYPVYHMKYVYIYDVTPDYVWMGYTPGYLNTFIYGPTIVYGTGYYYRPWYRRHYFPRPYTWGFSVRYNPWFGWGIGFSFSSGWFNGGFYSGRSYGYGGGWWGPRNYRPSYCSPSYRYQRGYYGWNASGYNRNRSYNQVYRSYNSNNNIYSNRGGIVSTNSRNYSPVRRGNERNNWSYNNNRGRNNNIQNNRVEEPGGRSSDISNGGGNNNNGPIRTRPQDMGNNSRYNNRNNNAVNPSRSPERFTPGSNDNRNSNPRNDNNIDASPQRGNTIERARPQQQSQDNSRDWRNNNPRVEQRTVPDRISQPQRRDFPNSQQNQNSGLERQRVYRQQPSQSPTERRESVRPNPSQRTESTNSSRPTRINPGGNRDGERSRN
jgi:hypothetical protein